MNGSTKAQFRVAIVLLVGLAAVPAAPARPALDPLLPKGPDDVNSNASTCMACHKNTPDDIKNNVFAKRFRSHEYIRLDEGHTWLTQDAHSAASTALRGALGKQMATALKYDVTQAPGCLTCHGTDKNPTAALPANTGAEKDVAERFEAEGVSCASCHGLRKDWQQRHYEDKGAPGGGRTIPWRTFTPERKEAAGLRNVRDPVVVARLCVSCHVGSPEEGKVLTHDMYAAGHPPLPPFEIITFIGGMPRHRNYPTDPQMKFFTPEGFKEYAGEEFANKNKNWTWDLYRFHPAGKEVYLTRHVVASAVASLEAEMRLLRAFAKDAEKGGDIDSAAFACSACHHDLKLPKDRQPPGGVPARPALKHEHAALAIAAAEHASQSLPALDAGKELRKKLAALDGAAQGLKSKPGPLGEAAADVVKTCTNFRDQFGKAHEPLYTPARVQELLQAINLAADEKGNTDDAATAAHLMWGYLALRSAAGAEAIPADKLRALGEVLPLRVRSEPYTTKDGEPVLAGAALRDRLELFNKYQPEKFKKAFRAVAGEPKRP